MGENTKGKKGKDGKTDKSKGGSWGKDAAAPSRGGSQKGAKPRDPTPPDRKRRPDGRLYPPRGGKAVRERAAAAALAEEEAAASPRAGGSPDYRRERGEDEPVDAAEAAERRGQRSASSDVD